MVIGITGTTGQTPGAPLPLPTREESTRRLLTHELGHGLAEAAHSIEPGLFDDYKREVGWVATQPSQLFDIGQPMVQTAIASGSPPPAQFEITVNNWNSPQWVEQPVSSYMVSGGPSEDFAEAVMTFVREPNLLLSRSPAASGFFRPEKIAGNRLCFGFGFARWGIFHCPKGLIAPPDDMTLRIRNPYG